MDIAQEIQAWKQARDTVILAHYYVEPEVQELADYVGDSFFLSKKAVELPQSTILFCGVSFMGESAKLLNPDKTVLMAEPAADCPMAHMADPQAVEEMRAYHPDLAVVCYINSTAALKACADVCVTSANAVDIVRALPQRRILFLPDRNLARYVAAQVPEKEILLPNGFCPTHDRMLSGEVARLKELHPEALVLAHPECPQAVTDLADYVGSTTGILRFAAGSPAPAFIVCTEHGVRHPLTRENPGKRFYFPQPTPVCPDMKTITPEKILQVLQTGAHPVEVDPALMTAARRPLDEMLRLAR